MIDETNDSNGSADGNVDGNGSAGSSADDSSGKENSGGKSGSQRTVSLEDHERALNDLKKFKSSNRELSEQFASLKKQIETEREESLRKSRDYKGLYETEAEKSKRLAQDAENLRNELTTRDKQRDQNARFNAVQSAAIQMGLRPEAVEDLSYLEMEDEVSVEVTNTGKLIVRGHKDFAEKLKASKPHWFTNPKAPGVNSGGGGVPPAGSRVSELDCFKADKDLKLGKISSQQRDEIYRRYDEGRKAKA